MILSDGKDRRKEDNGLPSLIIMRYLEAVAHSLDFSIEEIGHVKRSRPRRLNSLLLMTERQREREREREKQS
jgi:hypothetical protein